MDSTKIACADLRHRMILHNADLGAELAARAFPQRCDAREIALRHVDEDLGYLPSLSHWIAQCEAAKLPKPLARRAHIPLPDVAEKLAVRQHLATPDLTLSVLALLLLPLQFAGREALPILFNSYGPVLVRQIMGPPRPVIGEDSREVIFDAAYMAEALIYWLMGTIPQLSNVVFALRKIPNRISRHEN